MKEINDLIKDQFTAKICLVSSSEVLSKISKYFISKLDCSEKELLDYLYFKRRFILFRTLTSEISVYNKKEGTISFKDDFDLEFDKHLINLSKINSSNDNLISRTTLPSKYIGAQERVAMFDSLIEQDIEGFIGINQISYRSLNKFYHKISSTDFISESERIKVILNKNYPIEKFTKSFNKICQRLEEISNDEIQLKFNTVGLLHIFQNDDDNDIYTYYLKANQYFNNDQNNFAINYFSKAIKIITKDKLFSNDEVVNVLSTTVFYKDEDISFTLIDLYHLRGVAKFRNKDKDAINDFTIAIYLSPKYEDSYYMRALSYYLFDHDYKSSEDDVRDYLKLSPNDSAGKKLLLELLKLKNR
ncbi:hypothetical protein OAR04_03205 [Flavobacteriales bacterium]|nr:hypothetical protein [Flavobacteriales bacterium]